MTCAAVNAKSICDQHWVLRGRDSGARCGKLRVGPTRAAQESERSTINVQWARPRMAARIEA